MNLLSGILKYILIAILAIAGIFIYKYYSSSLLITVSGIGEVTVPATSASLTISVSENGESRESALAGLKTKVAGVRNILERSGVNNEEIVETDNNIEPIALIGQPAGFRAITTLGAKISKPGNMPSLSDSLYQNGALFVSQPILSSEDREVWEDKAIDVAKANADEKAAKLAKKYGKSIKKVVEISVGDTVPNPVNTGQTQPNTNGNGAAPDKSPVNYSLTRLVSVTYRLR